jgi:hypothetical protein
MPSELKTLSPSLIFLERYLLQINRFLSRPCGRLFELYRKNLVCGKINNNSLSEDLNLYITSIFLKEAKITDLKGETRWLKKE